MRETDTGRTPGDITTAALAWLLLLVVVLGPVAAAVFGWDSVTLRWFAAPAGGLLLVVALRMWSYGVDDEKTNVLLETASWLFPPVKRFRDTVDGNLKRIRENAQLINNMRSVLRSYCLGDIDEDAADEFASRRKERGIDVRDLTRSDVANFLAVEINEREAWGAGLALCLEVLHADQFDEAPPSASRPALDTSLLAGLVVRHPLVATIDAEYDEARVRTILEGLPRYDLNRVIDELGERKEGLVENMESVLKIYHLGKLGLKDRVEIATHVKASTYDLPSECAHQFVSRLELDQPAWMLELLYRDRYRRSTERLWSEHRSEAADVAPVLLESDLPFARAGRLDAGTLVDILNAMETFDTSLVTLVDLRLGGLLTLARHYAQYLQTQGVDCEVALPDITTLIKSKFPVNTADMWRLRVTDVDLEVLRCLGRSWIKPFVNGAAEEGPSAAPTLASGDDALAVAVVAAGNYLAHFAKREGLLPDLARGAGRSDDKDRAAEVLLAQLWYEQSGSFDATPVTVDKLATNFRRWLVAARGDLGATLSDDVVSSITEELIQGHWPTKLPSDRTMAELLAHQMRIAETLNQIRDTKPDDDELKATLQELREMIGAQRLSVDPTSTTDAETALDAAYRDIHNQVGELRVRWSDELSAAMAQLVDRSALFDTVESAADEATRTRRELVVEARLAADQATATTIDRLSADLRHLTDTDSELAERVGGVADALTETDASLAEAVRDLELMMANDICHSRHYILTFDSKTGPVGRLIDVLTTHPDFHNDYDFRHYTANARFGTMPEGMTFEEFHENLTADIARVFAHRKELVPNYDWSWDHDLARTEVTVVLYATALRKNVFSGARWWRRSGSTANLP